MEKEYKIEMDGSRIEVSANGFTEIELIGILEREKNRLLVSSLRDDERNKNEKLEYLLTSCLNDATIGRGRIKGIVSSNKIGEFVNEWMLKNKL